MATMQSCDTIWNGSNPVAMTPEQSRYFTLYIRKEIVGSPYYQSQIKKIVKTAKVSEDVALKTLPLISWHPEDREGSIVIELDGKYYPIRLKGDLKKKVKALFSQPREAPQPAHQDFQLQLPDQLVLAVALPVASDGLRLGELLKIAAEHKTDAMPKEQLQVQRDALQGFQEALDDVAKNYQTLEQRCLQSSDRMLQLQQSNNKSIRDIAMGAVGVLVAILAIKIFSTF